MNWNPVNAYRRATAAWRGDPASIDLSGALKQATAAEAERNAMRSHIRDLRSQVHSMAEAAIESASNSADVYKAEHMQRIAELVEARNMGGTGPWLVAEAREKVGKPGVKGHVLREANPILSQGAYGDIDLAMQNVEWRREINLSWLEFSRWGIQQIILVSRLYYIKNPIIRRLIDVSSCYVFGRGFEVSSPDEDANDVLKDFLERNQRTLGQIALTTLERAKYTDGNLFFALFADKADKGLVNIRTIDPTEIQDIIYDPDDSETPWYYHRSWNIRRVDERTGAVSQVQDDCWYPALEYEPSYEPDKIQEYRVEWGTRIHHRKCGTVSKWSFGCPLIFPALDWAREARRYLEACASVMAALSQIAYKITTKGGQQAMSGIKQQMETTVSVGSNLFDTNPPAVAGATMAMGPGTSVEAMRSNGAAQDPEKVRQYKLMCCMTVGVPETFLADVSTGNLATATTLDRPTELVFLERQEAWREDLVIIAKYVLKVSGNATNGKLREAFKRRAISDIKGIEYHEVARTIQPDGRMGYVEAKKNSVPRIGKSPSIEVKATFPSIREGDIPELVAATIQAMTLGGSTGVTGIDEKQGVKMLYELLGVEDGDELAEEMYPDGEYDPNRENQKQKAMEQAQAIAQSQPAPGQPAPGGDQGGDQPAPAAPEPDSWDAAESAPAKLSVREVIERAQRILKEREAEIEDGIELSRV